MRFFRRRRSTRRRIQIGRPGWGHEPDLRGWCGDQAQKFPHRLRRPIEAVKPCPVVGQARTPRRAGHHCIACRIGRGCLRQKDKPQDKKRCAHDHALRILPSRLLVQAGAAGNRLVRDGCHDACVRRADHGPISERMNNLSADDAPTTDSGLPQSPPPEKVFHAMSLTHH